MTLGTSFAAYQAKSSRIHSIARAKAKSNILAHGSAASGLARRAGRHGHAATEIFQTFVWGKCENGNASIGLVAGSTPAAKCCMGTQELKQACAHGVGAIMRPTHPTSSADTSL